MTGKEKFVEGYLDILLKDESIRLDNLLAEVVIQNNKAQASVALSSPGFMFAGKRYLPARFNTLQPNPKQFQVNLPVLSSRVMDFFHEVNSKINALARDRVMISQSLFTLLHPCMSIEDAANVLPNIVIKEFPSMVRTRTQEEMFAEFGFTRKVIQNYERALARIEFFKMSKLIF